MQKLNFHQKLEIYLNFPDVFAAVSQPKDCRRNIFSHFESGSLLKSNDRLIVSTILFRPSTSRICDEAGTTSDKENRSKKTSLFLCIVQLAI